MTCTSKSQNRTFYLTEEQPLNFTSSISYMKMKYVISFKRVFYII